MANNANDKLLEKEATESVNAVETASVEQVYKKRATKKKVFQEVTISSDGAKRKVAFAKGINRTVNLKNADAISENIEKKGYRDAEKIQVIEAETAIKNGDLKLVDIKGNEIERSKASEYYLVVDGQHRVYAVAMYNERLKQENEGVSAIEVPAVIIKLVNDETVAEYINDINITKQEWKIADYVQGAANVHKDNKFLHTYQRLIKSKERPDGFPISTLNRIFCGNQTAISQKDFSLLCSGITEKGKIQKDIIPAHNIENGLKFIQICREKGFLDKDIAKRFLISEFNDIKQGHSLEKAFEVFSSITPNDKEAMFNERKNLDEKLVREQIQTIVNRQ